MRKIHKRSLKDVLCAALVLQILILSTSSLKFSHWNKLVQFQIDVKITNGNIYIVHQWSLKCTFQVTLVAKILNFVNSIPKCCEAMFGYKNFEGKKKCDSWSHDSIVWIIWRRLKTKPKWYSGHTLGTFYVFFPNQQTKAFRVCVYTYIVLTSCIPQQS